MEEEVSEDRGKHGVTTCLDNGRNAKFSTRKRHMPVLEVEEEE